MLPGNLITDFPLNICVNCCASSPKLEKLYYINSGNGQFEYAQYELTCEHLQACTYALMKGDEDNGKTGITE